MYKLPIAQALILGVSPLRTNFAEGVKGDENLKEEKAMTKQVQEQHPELDSSFIQLQSSLESQSLSEIYTQWVELPDCQKFVLEDGTWDPAKGPVVPLAGDLTNASIATCKGSAKPWSPPPQPYVWTTNYTGWEEPVPIMPIFDPVWKTSQDMEDYQHQVATADMPTGVGVGPRATFPDMWKYKDGTNQPWQRSGDSWDESGPGGKDYQTYDWRLGYANGLYANETYFKLLQPPINMPNGRPRGELEDEGLVQLGSKWVELPNCDDEGADTKLALKDDLSNASTATCKIPGPKKTAEGKIPTSVAEVNESFAQKK